MHCWQDGVQPSTKRMRWKDWQTLLWKFVPLNSLDSSHLWVEKFLLIGHFKQTLLPLSVFPPNFVVFLLIYRSDVDLEHKRNIKRWYCSSSVAVVVIESYLWFSEAKFGFLNHYIRPWIWGLHSVPIVINFVNQNHESRIDINEKCCVTYSKLHYWGNSGNKRCTKKWPSS